ncbi:CesT family type III secretion system chaperone [Pseudomonas sp. JZ134]|uniref:CesT family type III secretion system chaperone n=1 Tax=Pseudomonas sp. JZ134 TaxID=2806615 RepID=UPI003DA0AEA0
MSNQQFNNVVAPLLSYLSIQTPMTNDDQAILIDFKNLQLQITPLNNQELLLVASLGVLPPDSLGALAKILLGANSIDPIAPPISVSVIGSQSTLILWSRERFVHLNSAEIIVLFDRLVSKANRLIEDIRAESLSSGAPVKGGEIKPSKTVLTSSCKW